MGHLKNVLKITALLLAVLFAGGVAFAQSTRPAEGPEKPEPKAELPASPENPDEIVLEVEVPEENLSEDEIIRRNMHKLYEPIRSSKADEMLSAGIEYAKFLYGEPPFPISRVYLRKSRPIDPRSGLRSDFVMTDMLNPDAGTHAIFLIKEPGDLGFEAQFAHEICHLLNPKLYDLYFEGLCTVFAEKFAEVQGIDWMEQMDLIQKSAGGQMYYQTYLMMKDVSDIAGEEAMGRLLRFAAPLPPPSTNMYLDMASWLETLPEEKAEEIRSTIQSHRNMVISTLKDINYLALQNLEQESQLMPLTNEYYPDR